MSEFLKSCAECSTYYVAHPKILECCLVIGKEFGFSAESMLQRYLKEYHEAGHIESKNDKSFV